MKCFIAALCVVLSGCLTAPNFLGFSFGPSAYQKQEDLPNGTVMLSDSERFSATVNRYWVYAPADTHISSTEYDLEHYGVQLLKDGPAAIGKSATVIGEYHAFYVAEVEGLGYLFAPKFDIRDQIEQKRAQAEYERNYQALIKLFR